MDLAALQHSVFLQALGSAILNSLWQCFLLWLIYETISVSYRSASAKFKNNLGTLLLFVSFGWFVSSFLFKFFNKQHLASPVAIAKGFSPDAPYTVHADSGFNTFLSYASASLPYLSVAYIFLLFFLMSRLFAAYRYVYYISNKRLINPTKELQLFAFKAARNIGITKKISVWISHHIDVPATIGFVKPVILIPLASINNLSCQQLEAIILHELAHIKRNDYITNLIISVIETVLFFNPFTALLANSIKRERENCCDDFVLQYRYDPHSYASALLRLEESRMRKLKLAIGAVSGKNQLLSRIKRITNSPVVSRQFYYGQKLIALILVTACICSVAWLSPKEKKSVITKLVVKENKSVHLKITSTNKIQLGSEVIMPGKQIEDVPETGIKPQSSKHDRLTFHVADAENLSQNNSSDEDDVDEKTDDADLLQLENTQSPEVENIQSPEVINAKEPLFFADEKNLKLPSFIYFKNFLFENMNLNIDLSKAEVDKLNKNLKEAYKQVNAVEWNNIQNEIRRNFSNMKLNKLIKKQRDVWQSQTAKSDGNIMSMAEPKNNAKEFIQPRVKKEIFLRELIQNSMNAARGLNNDDNSKLQQALKTIQQQVEKNTARKYYFSYSNNTVADNDDDPKSQCDQKSHAPVICKESRHRSISAIQSHGGVSNDKKILQFSFYKNDEKSNPENIIRVELNNVPD